MLLSTRELHPKMRIDKASSVCVRLGLARTLDLRQALAVIFAWVLVQRSGSSLVLYHFRDICRARSRSKLVVEAS